MLAAAALRQDPNVVCAVTTLPSCLPLWQLETLQRLVWGLYTQLVVCWLVATASPLPGPDPPGCTAGVHPPPRCPPRVLFMSDRNTLIT
jgi:hypothetical protein